MENLIPRKIPNPGDFESHGILAKKSENISGILLEKKFLTRGFFEIPIPKPPLVELMEKLHPSMRIQFPWKFSWLKLSSKRLLTKSASQVQTLEISNKHISPGDYRIR